MIALVGCDDAMSPPAVFSEHALHSIVMRVDAATPAECPDGGSVTRAGIDSDGDGTLADGEVTGQSVICQPKGEEPQPAPAPQVLVRYLTGTAAGGHCPGDGVVVQAGIDGDGNGQLDDHEATHTDYLCNGGHEGEPTPASQVLVRFLTNAAGAHCPGVGDIVQAGLDGNGNGQLDDNEVTHTDYLCIRG
ncbi:MAG: hypothetical protein ABIY55_26645 [Kofleriaceae bacterium]